MTEQTPTDRTITTDTGSTISLTDKGGETMVVLDHPDAPEGMRHCEAGRVIEGGFQPVPFAAYGLTPTALRAIADLIEGERRA